MIKYSTSPIFREVVKFVRDHYCVKLSVRVCAKGANGYARCGEIVIVNEFVNIDRMLSTIFHELGHIYCWRKNIWPAYHKYAITKKQKKLQRATAWRAEQWVDRWGEKEMKKHFPKRTFHAGYTTEEDKQWLME